MTSQTRTMLASRCAGWKRESAFHHTVNRDLRAGGAAADSVEVIKVVEAGSGRAAPEDLVGHPAWHGIAARALSVDPGAPAIGEALLRQAERIDTDLLVVGG